MKNKAFEWTACTIAVLVLTAGVGAQSQNWAHKDKKFTGVINAYSPQLTSSTGAVTGPYEIRGPWSLKLKRNLTKADFSADLDMNFSDGWVLTLNKGNFDPTMRNAHTHHVSLVDGDVTLTATGGYQITGTATVTLNGNPAPLTVAPTQVVIVISGGSDVEFSNITVTFQSPGSSHFGSAPLPGVIRKVTEGK